MVVVVVVGPVPKQDWYFMVLVLSLASLKGSNQLKDGDNRVTLTDGMVLNCTCPWSGTLTMFSWTKEGKSVPFAVFHPDFGSNLSEEYDGRVSFLKSSELDGSISISGVSGSDEGRYLCSIQTFPKGPWNKYIHVERQETRSPVIPGTDPVVSANRSVLITCKNLWGGVVNEVSMEMMERAGGAGSSVVAVCRMTEGGVELEWVSHSGTVNCSMEMEMELWLEDGAGDDGVYRCNFSTDLGLYLTDAHYTVIHTEAPHSRGFEPVWYVYIGAGGAAALILIGVILLYAWIHRRRERRLEYIISSHAAKRQNNECEHGGVYDRMKKTTRLQRKNDPVYANIRSVRAERNKKR